MIGRRRSQANEKRVLVKAILRLPVNLRDVFLLHRMAGLSYGEIGLRLGMDSEAVEAALADALVWLAIRVAPRRARPTPTRLGERA